MSWRSSLGGPEPTISSNKQHRLSYDGPANSRSWRSAGDDDRDDMEIINRGSSSLSSRETLSSSYSDDKITKFDALLRRIESEREKIATSPQTTSGAPTSSSRQPRRRRNNELPTTSNNEYGGGEYDFAARAKELRLSCGAPPTAVSSLPMKSRVTIQDGSMESTPQRSKSRQDNPPRSAGNTNASPIRSSSPSREVFRQQIDKFHNNLVSAHDTINILEKDISMLKKKSDEKDDCIDALDRRNKSLNETVVKLEGDFLTDKHTMSKQHADEIDKLQREFETYQEEIVRYKRDAHVHDTNAKDLQKEKQQLEKSIQDKDDMISIQRHEISRLNEELADGAFVRAQAEKEKEHSKQIEVELDKMKADHASATQVIKNLEMQLKQKEDDFTNVVAEKEEAARALKSELESGKTLKQSSIKMEEKADMLEAQLNKSRVTNEELSEEVKDLKMRLEQKDEEIEELESSILDAESREKDLKRQLEKEQRELERQRKRFDKYDTDCAMEQETISKLEQAIEELEQAHDESQSQIARLQEERNSLTETLTEVEEYMNIYKTDVKEATQIKSMMNELQDINLDLGRQLRVKDDEIRQLQTRNVQSEKELSAIRKSMDEQDITAKKLNELTVSNEAELQALRSNKNKMIDTVSQLGEQLKELKMGADKRDDNEKLEKAQSDAARAWARVSEQQEEMKILQKKLSTGETAQNGDSDELILELRAKLMEKDDQLADSKSSIVEAQKMIYRLMTEVKELRKKGEETRG